MYDCEETTCSVRDCFLDIMKAPVFAVCECERLGLQPHGNEMRLFFSTGSIKSPVSMDAV